MNEETKTRILALAVAAENESAGKCRTMHERLVIRTELSSAARYLGHGSGCIAGEEYKKETE